jgi:hypothetical protein
VPRRHRSGSSRPRFERGELPSLRVIKVRAKCGTDRARTIRDQLAEILLPTHGMGSGRELNRAISAGLIIVEHEHAKRYRLFATERGRMRWHLVCEIMTPGMPARRVAGLRAEISALDAERAASGSTTV